MNAAQRNRHTALLKATGFHDEPALTAQSTDGDIPHGRELSIAWLSGTVMTGLTGVLLMGAALYVSFLGQDTFSTPYAALTIESPQTTSSTPLGKTDRAKPVTHTRSEKEVIEASIRVDVNGVERLRKQPFVRISATLATAPTALSGNIPAYDPVALLSQGQPENDVTPLDNAAIYGTDVEGEVTVKTVPLPLNMAPARVISDAAASEFVKLTLEGAYSEQEITALGYAADASSVRDLGTGTSTIAGVAENVTIVPKSLAPEDASTGRTERFVTIRQQTSLEDALTKNGFTAGMISKIARTLHNVFPSTQLSKGTRLRILFGPSAPGDDTLIPYRMSIYVNDRHAATVAWTDQGQYVLGLAPPDVPFPADDTEEVNVNSLPTIYRAIWETGRKHDLDDNAIKHIVAMFAYDVDLTKKVTPGDSIDLLETEPDKDGHQELLYVGLKLDNAWHDLYRFRSPDGTVAYYDPNGQSGKRFLTRRPVEGGGRISSRFGYRMHPIFHRRILHAGVDLAAPYHTPIYAAGDGVVEKAQWVSGYGRFVMLKHVNGYETGYGHMSAFAKGLKPGMRVRQGQIIGYVGSTGNSTGNHLHFEIRVNGHPVDPLSVKLPRDKSLPPQYQRDFTQQVAQIKDLMTRDASPIQVASNQ
ncbi:MAG TPA: M23 family metallopeptidase [Devosiaceae bacterium]